MNETSFVWVAANKLIKQENARLKVNKTNMQ